MPDGRQFDQAWLVVPGDFLKQGLAYIRLSQDAVLRLPHVEGSGKLCIKGDPGAASGALPEARIDDILARFSDEFLTPWRAGYLDEDFEREALSYWRVRTSQVACSSDAVRKIFTVDPRSPSPRVYSARLLLPNRYVVAGDNPPLSDNFVASLGNLVSEVQSVIVADIPIPRPLTPMTWPRNQSKLEKLLVGRLDGAQLQRFNAQAHRRKKKMHRVVILRAPNSSFGFLLTGGPATIIRRGRSARSFVTHRMVPLAVERIDPMWTHGRDQHAVVRDRQQQHVLVLGAGALGSFVIDQLAKAGVGRISVVDPDVVSSANIGRHLLGAESVGQNKAQAVARRVQQSNPASRVDGFPLSAHSWIAKQTLREVTAVLDLTGEPEVRGGLDEARTELPFPLLIGWMEPYVAAAHACLLPPSCPWMTNAADPMTELQAVDWPDDVMQQEPACSSEFQSYTPSAAAYAVALVAEAALSLLDGEIETPRVRSWLRGQRYLDAHHPDLVLRDWARFAAPFDGLLHERAYPA